MQRKLNDGMKYCNVKSNKFKCSFDSFIRRECLETLIPRPYLNILNILIMSRSDKNKYSVFLIPISYKK